MSEDFQFDVFLSYTSMDNSFTRELVERLKRDGLKVWSDEQDKVATPERDCAASIEQEFGYSKSRNYSARKRQTHRLSDWLVENVRERDDCDEASLLTQQQLDFFSRACHAVRHAHQKRIIHHDIKPSNILVFDGLGMAKILDFGISKATATQQVADKSFALFEQSAGRPPDMSPEHPIMTGVSSDIYSLGVILYELSTGRKSFDARERLQSGLDEILRTMRVNEPQGASARCNLWENLRMPARLPGLDVVKLSTVATLLETHGIIPDRIIEVAFVRQVVPYEQTRKGLNRLWHSLKEFCSTEAQVCKWRALFLLGSEASFVRGSTPRAHAMARCVSLCQEMNPVPVIEMFKLRTDNVAWCEERTRPAPCEMFNELERLRVDLGDAVGDAFATVVVLHSLLDIPESVTTDPWKCHVWNPCNVDLHTQEFYGRVPGSISKRNGAGDSEAPPTAEYRFSLRRTALYRMLPDYNEPQLWKRILDSVAERDNASAEVLRLFLGDEQRVMLDLWRLTPDLILLYKSSSSPFGSRLGEVLKRIRSTLKRPGAISCRAELLVERLLSYFKKDPWVWDEFECENTIRNCSMFGLAWNVLEGTQLLPVILQWAIASSARPPERILYLLASKLAQKLGIEIVVEHSPAVPASCIEIDGETVIYLHDRLSIQERAWSICHEIAHLSLKHIPASEYGLDASRLSAERKRHFAEQEHAADLLASVWCHLFDFCAVGSFANGRFRRGENSGLDIEGRLSENSSSTASMEQLMNTANITCGAHMNGRISGELGITPIESLNLLTGEELSEIRQAAYSAACGVLTPSLRDMAEDIVCDVCVKIHACITAGKRPRNLARYARLCARNWACRYNKKLGDFLPADTEEKNEDSTMRFESETADNSLTKNVGELNRGAADSSSPLNGKAEPPAVHISSNPTVQPLSTK